MKIAIQGELGAFSHEAASRMVPRCTIVPCARSAEVFERVERGSVDGAVIPIENSLAGSVGEHLDLLLSKNVFVQGEFPLRIAHNLIAAPGVKLRDVQKVYSHPVALDQCREFFRRHRHIEPVAFYGGVFDREDRIEEGAARFVDPSANGSTFYSFQSSGEHHHRRDEEARTCTAKYCNERCRPT